MKINHLAVCIVSVLMLFTLVGCYDEDAAIAENKKIASEIIKALDSYEQKYGSYPDRLDDLSPEFLIEIPLTVDGDTFGYRAYSSTDYEFGFALRTNMGCGYLPKYQYWECSPDPEKPNWPVIF